MSNDIRKMIVVTAPSGAGKSTIVRHLLKNIKNLSFSISATTRRRRPKEVEGTHYYFKSLNEFKELMAKDAFVEWEEVYEDQYYGTLKSEIERIWNQGNHIIFDIDVNGARDIKHIYRKKALTIFIKPPSFEVLIERLMKRGTENEQSLKKRIARIRRELTFENKFDYCLLNDRLEDALIEALQVSNDFLLNE